MARATHLCALAVAIGATIAAPAPAHASTWPSRMGLYVVTNPTHSLPMLDSKLVVTMHGPIAEVVVTQHFENRTDHVVEAVYVFPLPADAAVSAMAMRLGTRTIHAAIAPRADAKRRYEAAIAAGVGGAMLEQERPDVFTQTVAAIPAHGGVDVTLRYDTVAAPRAGTWELALPLVVAPRYVPGSASGRPTTGAGRAPDTDRAPDASRVTPPTDPDGVGPTTIALELGDAVDDLASPTHDLVISPDRTHATLTDAHSDHDAIVRWRAPAPAAGWVEQDGADAYAAVVVEAAAPPAPTPNARAPHATRVLLVLDRAATARGGADATLHPLVHALLDALAPGDRVTVIGSDQLAAQAPADARAALDAHWAKPTGAFDLTRVLAGAHPNGAAVVLVGDGLVADDAAALAAARALGVPVHVIGIGPSPARGLLGAIASTTAGTVRYASPGDDLETLARDTLVDAGGHAPAVAINWGTLAAHDVVPAALPRLGVGQAIVVVARVGTATAANGRTRGEVFAIEPVRVAAPPAGATSSVGPLARRWARLRLDDLLAARAPDVAAITAHALAFGLVSPYTAMVAIGDDVVVQGGVKHSIAVPVAVPAGMRWQEVHDEQTVTTVTAAAEVEQKPAEQKPAEQKPEEEHHTRRASEPASGKSSAPSGAPKHTAPIAHEPAPIAVRDTPDARVTPAPPPAVDTPALSPPASPKAHEQEHDHAADADADEVVDGDDNGAATAPGGKNASRSVQPAASPEGAEDNEVAQTMDYVVSASAEPMYRPWRVALGIAGGVELTGPHGLVVIDARVDYGARTRVGLDASLWLVDGTHGQGHVLATIARTTLGAGWIGRRFELAAGVGVQLASASGVAFGVALRYTPFVHATVLDHLAIALRYDGALVWRDGNDSGEHALTIGVDWRW